MGKCYINYNPTTTTTTTTTTHYHHHYHHPQQYLTQYHQQNLDEHQPYELGAHGNTQENTFNGVQYPQERNTEIGYFNAFNQTVQNIQNEYALLFYVAVPIISNIYPSLGYGSNRP